ncbi:MAG: hypothetical protein ABWW70_00705 [Thermoproteota archaeon]
MVQFRRVPVYYAIVDELEQRGGRAKDWELFKALRERYELTFSELLHELMKLEVNGIVRVHVLKENERLVELVSKP